jgi:hypothetical protein
MHKKQRKTMTPINKFHRNQLIKRIVKKVEKAFQKELDEHMDYMGGSCDYGDFCSREGFKDLATTTIETFKEEI